jgi:predicted HTH domain antitoxin
MSSTRFSQASQQEGKILLAIQALKRGQISSLQRASALFSVPHSTLHDRLHGHTTQENTQ